MTKGFPRWNFRRNQGEFFIFHGEQALFFYFMQLKYDIFLYFQENPLIFMGEARFPGALFLCLAPADKAPFPRNIPANYLSSKFPKNTSNSVFSCDVDGLQLMVSKLDGWNWSFIQK